MKRFLLIAALACSMGSAIAADMPPVKAVAPIAPVTANASGFYFGAVAFADKTRGNFGAADVKPSGTMGGIVAGYALYAGQALFSIEADAQYTLARDTKACGTADICDMKPTWFMSQRVVIGMPLTALTGAVQRPSVVPTSQWPTMLNMPATLASATMMPYLTAGIGERRFQTCVDAAACEKTWRGAWVAGGGFKIPVSAGFTADIGYLYAGYRKHSTEVLPGFSPASEQMVKASLNYHM